ncbi:MAG: ABC transporter ATP-binding protein [Proteobacteria bacterium]|nr:ABC transporter ATP-binding protein [Pseudomonadota bacterium]
MDASFSLMPGEILGLVGESGSGKTTLGLALLAHCRRGLTISGGRVAVGGRDLLTVPRADLPRIRKSLIRYVPQDSGAALNPALRIRTQLAENFDDPGAVQDDALVGLLEEVKLPARRGLLRAYPHQLSGGQQQRVAIAMAFAGHPRVVVMDEPTTGLDVTTQAHVLQTVRQLCREHGIAAVYVSHDLAVVASLAHRVAVMYAGRVVELGPTAEVLHAPLHPYTTALIRAVPDIASRSRIEGIPGQAPEPGRRQSGCSFAPRCGLATPQCGEAVPVLAEAAPGHPVRCIRAGQSAPAAAVPVAVSNGRETAAAPVLHVAGLVASYGTTQILHDVSFDVPDRSCVALVGESGSGKTTLARTIGGLHGEVDGIITYRGQTLPVGSRHRSSALRRRIQYIFQNPYASLNPRRSIGQSIAVALQTFESVARPELRRRVAEALDQVSLPASAVDRRPHELSGGQLQRAAIARALVVAPDLLICDEVTSALDVSVQAVIVALLGDLQRERGLSMLFITHNLALIRGIAQSVVVLQSGRVIEAGATDRVLDAPRADETRRLLADVPRFTAV